MCALLWYVTLKGDCRRSVLFPHALHLHCWLTRTWSGARKPHIHLTAQHIPTKTSSHSACIYRDIFHGGLYHLSYMDSLNEKQCWHYNITYRDICSCYGDMPVLTQYRAAPWPRESSWMLNLVPICSINGVHKELCYASHAVSKLWALFMCNIRCPADAVVAGRSDVTPRYMLAQLHPHHGTGINERIFIHLKMHLILIPDEVTRWLRTGLPVTVL